MRKFLVAWMLVASGWGGCTKDHECDAHPAGFYDLDLDLYQIACTTAVFENLPKKGLLLADDVEHGIKFSADGCELSFRGAACIGGSGLCGEFHWVEAGVYQGDLTYVHGNSGGGWADCLIRTEEAKLTLTERFPGDNN